MIGEGIVFDRVRHFQDRRDVNVRLAVAGRIEKINTLREVPVRYEVDAKGIIHPLGDFVRKAEYIRKLRTDDVWSPPAFPNECLDEVRVVQDLTDISAMPRQVTAIGGVA